MATQLVQILTFADVAPGGTVALPHNINANGVAYIPDQVTPGAADSPFTVISCTSAELTVQNTGDETASASFLLQLWHSIDRAWGQGPSSGNELPGLTPRPFVSGGGGGGGGAGGTQYVFVVRPGGVEGANVYNDLADAAAAAALVEGQKIIEFDDVEEAVIISAGTYDITDCVLWGAQRGRRVTVTIEEGVELTGLRVIGGNLNINFAGENAPVTDLEENDEFQIWQTTSISCSDGGPFIDWGSVNTGSLYLGIGVALVQNNGVVVNISETLVTISAGPGCVIEDDTILSSAVVTYRAFSSGATLSRVQNGSTTTDYTTFVEPQARMKPIDISHQVYVATDANIAAFTSNQEETIASVKLPLAVLCPGKYFFIYNSPDWNQDIEVTPADGDTINSDFGVESVAVAPGKSLYLINNGANDWMVIAYGGTSGGGASTAQRFAYTVTGSEPDLSELTISLPAARADDAYQVQVTLGKVTAILGYAVDGDDQTTTEFVVRFSGNTTAGDVINFTVEDPT